MKLLLRLIGVTTGIFIILISGVLIVERQRSPGQWIAYHTIQAGSSDVYRIQPDGSHQQRLLHSTGSAVEPDWSPHGRMVALTVANRAPASIYMIPSDGSTRRYSRPINLVTLDQSRQPSWSPDNEWVAFATDHDRNYEIYRVRGDGSGEQRLTDSPGIDWNPDWSPDNQRIVFESTRDGNHEIYSMRTDGSDLKRLTFDPADDIMPDWSADSQWITFVSSRDGNREIYTMRADGSDVRRLTDNPGDDLAPAWSPDGAWIAFSSERQNESSIYLMRPDGSDLRRLTTDPGEHGRPAWSPIIDYSWHEEVVIALGLILIAISLRPEPVVDAAAFQMAWKRLRPALPTRPDARSQTT